MNKRHLFTILVFAMAVMLCGTATAEEQTTTQDPIQDISIDDTPNTMQYTQDTTQDTQSDQNLQTETSTVQDTSQDPVDDTSNTNTVSTQSETTNNDLNIETNSPSITDASKQVSNTQNTITQESITSTGLNNVYVSTTGSDTSGDGSQANPYQTILTGINNVNSGGTVHLTNGTYSGTGNYGITINKNLTISGQSQNSTIIDAQRLGRIFTVLSSVTVIIQNITLLNANSTDSGGAIQNGGTLNVTGSTFTSNTASGLGGGAIQNGGTLNIIDSHFSSNSVLSNTAYGYGGGAIQNGGTLNIIDSHFSSNSVLVDSQVGSAILNLYGTCIITSSTFNNNNGSYAIYNTRGTLNVIGSELNNNTGGAIYNARGPLNVTGSTFINNVAYQGGAISGGICTAFISNCTFIGNTADGGGAIYISYLEGNVANINDSTFTSNTANWGGAIYNGHESTLNIKNCELNNNIATSIGGAIYNGSILNIINSSFSNNTVTGNGGAIYNYANLNVTACTFIGNTATYGGAIYSYQDTTNLTAHFNRFIGNLANYATTLYGFGDATNNWWGSNTSPATQVSGNAVYDPWIVLTVSADPTNINTSENSQVTVDLTHNSNGEDTSGQGHVPDGIPVQFFATLGTINNTGTTVNGRATATFQTGSANGQATVQAKVDNQTVNTTITVVSPNSPPVLNPIGDKFVNEGQQLQFTVSGLDPNGDTLTYSASGLPIGAQLNSTTGEFTWTPTYNQAGSYSVTFTVSDGTLTDSKTAIINVTNILKDNIYVSPTGSDATGDGTQNSPYQTILKAINEVKATGTIYLADGIYSSTGDYGITIDKDLNLIGQSQSGTIIDAQGLDRIFTILSGVTVTIQKLTLENGSAPNGGAIYNQGDLNLTNCNLLNNIVTNSSGYGGAIYNNNKLIVENCVFADNTVYNIGGAIYNNYGTLNIIGSSFTNSYAAAFGGAIYSNYGTLNITDSNFTSNIAGITGGTIYIYASPCTINNCSISNNLNGHAIYLDSATLDIINCTFNNNKGPVNWHYLPSGVIINMYGTLNVANSTFINNPDSVIQSFGSCNVIDSSFTNNTGTSINNHDPNIAYIENCTFTNNTASVGGGGAIFNGGNMTVKDSTFTNNNAEIWYGGAIYNYLYYGMPYSAILTVENCIFDGNRAGSGGAICNRQNGDVTVINSTFTNNYGGSAGAFYNEGDNRTKSNIMNSTFISNRGQNGGVFNNLGGSIKVNNCILKNNSAEIIGGAIYNVAADSLGGSSFEIHFSQIYDNPSNSEIYNVGDFGNGLYGTLNVQNNWWGSNDSPVTKITGTNVYYGPWIVLNVTAAPTDVNTGGNSQVTADLTHNSNGEDTSGQGHVPDGIPVQFFATLGTINNTGTTVNGRATATFQASNNGGQATVQAKVDDQTVTTNVEITGSNQPPVLDPIGDKTVNEGQQLQFTVTGSDPDGNSLAYSATGLPEGAIFNTTNGEFTWAPNYNQAGTYTVTFTVSDGTLTDSKTASINVIDTLRDIIYISPTGNDTTGAGTQNSPYQTIIKAINEVQAAGTIYLADGIYTGTGNRGITLNKDLSIIGQSQTGTIIDAQNADRVFTNPGVTVTIKNLTITNGNAANGGAIWNFGNLNVDKCTFSNGTTSYSGGAIASAGTLNVTDSTFLNNKSYLGGAISTNTALTVKNSSFTGNNAYKGAAIYKDGGNADIANITFTNNTSTNGGAIYNEGITTVSNSTFTDNNADQGGVAFNTGSLTVNNSTFTGNNATLGSGGAIANAQGGTLTVSNSTFTKNTSNEFAGALDNNKSTLTVNSCIFTDNSAKLDGGGAISSDGTLNVNNSTFTNNSAGTGTYPGGGALWNGMDGTMNVISNTFIGNTATYGGALYNYYGNVEMHFNRITGNIASEGSAIYSPDTLNAQNNWWGSNTSPANLISGNVVYDPWIILSITADPTTILTSGTSQITADLLHDSNGLYLDPVNGVVPDVPVEFTIGGITSLSTLSDGKATTTFQAGTNEGQVTAQAKVDDQTISTTITVGNPNSPPLAVPDGPYIAYEGSLITFDGSASTDPDGDILTYEWDLDGDGIFETPGMTVTKTWLDDYSGTVYLKVTDAGGLSNIASTTVNVQNVAPTASISNSYYVKVPITMLINGAKGNTVEIQIIQDGTVIASQKIIRDTDSPNEQEVTFFANIDMSKPYTGRIIFNSVTDSNGILSVWIVIDGKKTKVASFNSKKNNSPNQVYDFPLTRLFTIVGKEITFKATASDPGTDNITFTWNSGSNQQPVVHVYTSDGVNPITDSVTFTFNAKGEYVITLIVKDDDGAITEYRKTIRVI